MTLGSVRKLNIYEATELDNINTLLRYKSKENEV